MVSGSVGAGMVARITINLTATGEFELWLNEEGRDLLVQELQHLSEKRDHFHLGPKDIGDVEVSTVAYRPDDRVLEYGKVLFRTDAWDEKYFPHVMAETA
jgi:hypothetical protein